MASSAKTDNPHHLKKVNSQRLPPPSLFQGPPSHNASNLSLPQPAPTVGSRGGSQPPPSQRNRQPQAIESFDAPNPLSLFRSRAQSKGEVDASDAIWQEMQSALSEVELSAVTSDSVFGAKHSEALEDLRRKQLKLAQAWARSEAEEVVDTKGTTEERPPPLPRRDSQNPNTPSEWEAEALYHKNLDEETQRDILLARQRREANDRYFDRVNIGVLDVVAKLEEVAQAMRSVERESKDIWTDSDNMSPTTPSTNTG